MWWKEQVEVTTTFSRHPGGAAKLETFGVLEVTSCTFINNMSFLFGGGARESRLRLEGWRRV